MRAGRIETLTIKRVSDYGLYLTDNGEDEVLLPNRYVSLADKVGDRKEVFLFHDSEDRLTATTETPAIKAGEAAYLRVVDKNLHGAFLDWGITGKDLFLPNRNQQGGVLPGRSYIIYMYEDNVTGRCVATMKLKSYIDNDAVTVRPHQKVSALVASESPIGWRVVIDNRHWGMLYKNQVFRPLATGERVEAYVVRITDDNRIDLSLQRGGYGQVKDSSADLLALIEAAGGRIAVGDDSPAEDVVAATHMSKKTFKRALGMLLKAGRVTTDGASVELKTR